MIDQLSSMSSVHSMDLKTEKKSESEEIRPIEETGEGHNTELDIEREKIFRKPTDQALNRDSETLTYNANGDLKGLPDDTPQPPEDWEPLDLVV